MHGCNSLEFQQTFILGKQKQIYWIILINKISSPYNWKLPYGTWEHGIKFGFYEELQIFCEVSFVNFSFSKGFNS